MKFLSCCWAPCQVFLVKLIFIGGLWVGFSVTGLLQGEVQDEFCVHRVWVGWGGKDTNQMKITFEIFRK